MSGHTNIEPPQGAWPYQLKRSDGTGLYEPPVYEPKHPVLRWFESRLPIGGLIYSSVIAYPTLENLFGSLDYCNCPECRSILSPAAYLVHRF